MNSTNPPKKNSGSTLRGESPLTNRLTAAAAFALANAVAANAPATTNATTKLPEVLVTDSQEKSYKAEAVSSTKYTEPLRDIPQTITVIPRAVMAQQGATTLSEALRNIPSVTMLAGEGGGASSTAGDSFYMRGFDASSSIFVDGVRNQGLITRDVFNLEQVEIYKGPTGSDVGRGTASGYVNLSTKVPTLAPIYSGTLGYGSAEQKRFTADFNQPIKLGQQGDWINGSAFRLNGVWQEGGVAGRDEVNRESWSLAPSLALGLGTPTRLYLYTQHTRQDNLPDYGIPGRALTDDRFDRENYYGIPGYDFEQVEQDGYTARIEHDLNDDVTIRNQTHYTATHRLAVITSPNGVTTNAGQLYVTRSRQGNERENEILANQTSATAKFNTGKLAHTLNGGFEYSWEKQFAPTITGVGSVTNAHAFNPNPNDPVAAYNPRRSGAYTSGETTTFAGYVFDTITLSKRWQVSGGLRWEHYTTDYRSVQTNGTFLAGTPVSLSDNLLSWKAGLTFKPRENGSIYFSYGKTLTPPGTASLNLSTNAGNINNPLTQPQESENFEFGTKWDFFQEKLATTAAIFRTVNQNEISADAANPGAFIYDRERIVQGIELGAAGHITENWQAFANFSYLHTEFTESDTVSTDGSQLRWTPEFAASLWTTYRFPIGLTIGGGARYTSTVRRTEALTITGAGLPAAPDYVVLDAMAEYEVNQHFSLRLNVYNLTDELYSGSLNNNGQRFNPGPPLSFMLTASIKF